MPIYSTLCSICGEKGSVWRKIAERDSLPLCSCGGELTRIIDRPMVIGELTPYHSPNGGHLISSRAQRREDLRRSNAIEWEPGIEKDIARNLERSKEEAFKPLSAAVDQKVCELVQSGKLET